MEEEQLCTTLRPVKCSKDIVVGSLFSILGLALSAGFVISTREYETTPLWCSLAWQVFFTGNFPHISILKYEDFSRSVINLYIIKF